MKKKLFFIFFIFFIFSFGYSSQKNNNEFVIKIGYDRPGEQDISGWVQMDGISGALSLSEKIEDAFSFSGEYILRSETNYGLGAGASYQIPRKMKNYVGDFNFIPLYFLLKIYFPSHSSYLVGHFGYNLFNADEAYKEGGKTKGGEYYAIGGGFLLGDKIELEILKTFHQCALEDQTGYIYDPVYGELFYWANYEIKYSRYTISLGYRF